MKKSFVLILSVLFLALATGGALAASKAPIPIGYLANLTGDGASWGQHERNGAILAVEEINKAGGVLGRPLKLVVYDAKGRPEDAINAVRRMIDSDKVVAIGGANYSGINIATGPVVAAGKVPQIATFATNPFVTVDPKTNKAKPYSFRICFTDPYQGKVMAEYLVKKLGIKHAAVLSDVGSDYSEGMTEYFVKTFEGLGGKVESYKFRSGDVDFRAQLTNAKESGAKALVMPDLYKEMALMMKQSHELGWKPVFIGGDGYSNNMAEIAGPAMEGSYWVYHLSFDDPKIQPLVAKYTKRFGTPPTEVVNTVAAYDVVYWIADAIKRAGKADGAAVRDALASTKNLKLLHFTLTLDPRNNNPLNKPATMLQFKDGKIRYLETFKPQTEY